VLVRRCLGSAFVLSNAVSGLKSQCGSGSASSENFIRIQAPPKKNIEPLTVKKFDNTAMVQDETTDLYIGQKTQADSLTYVYKKNTNWIRFQEANLSQIHTILNLDTGERLWV
jgi:hypothetical protein